MSTTDSPGSAEPTSVGENHRDKSDTAPSVEAKEEGLLPPEQEEGGQLMPPEYEVDSESVDPEFFDDYIEATYCD